jgi:micrococcal nuclease
MIKFKIFTLLLISAGIGLVQGPVSYNRVKFVYDGDSILLNSGEKVRYLGIDTPEIDHGQGDSEFMADASKAFNLKLVGKAQIRLEFDRKKRDVYGRILAYVFLEDGRMINQILVRKGYAHVMFGNQRLRYEALLLDCQRRAMKEKLGIWTYLKMEDESSYVGNLKSRRFHGQHCHFGNRIHSKNLVRFKSCYDAFWHGYSPAACCRNKIISCFNNSHPSTNRE